jgi:predicted ATP-dependent serine protease
MPDGLLPKELAADIVHDSIHDAKAAEMRRKHGLKADCFRDKRHREIIKTQDDLIRQGEEQLFLALSEKVGSETNEYMRNLDLILPRTIDYETKCKKFKELLDGKQFKRAVTEALNNNLEDPGGLRAELAEIVKDYGNGKSQASQTEWNFRPADEILAEAQKLTWFIPNWLAPGNLTLLSATPKTGKSTLLLSLLLSLSCGGKFLGVEVPQKRVAFVCAEEGGPILKDRIEKMGGLNEDFLIHLGPKILNESAGESLRQFVTEEQVDVLALDPLVRLHNRKEDSSEAAIPVYLLVELARETGAAIILIHHDRKSGGEYGSQIRGSSAIFGAVDLAISMKRTSGQGHLVEVSTIGRICADTDNIVIELHQEGLIWSLKGYAQDVKFDKDQKAILEALESGHTKLKEIAEFAEIPDATCYRRIQRLIKQEKINSKSGGGYQLIK